MPDPIHTIKKYMSPAPQTISREASLTQAEELMKELHIRHLPVVDQGKIVGIISERDIHLIASQKGIHANEIPVDDAMTQKPYLADSQTPLEEVVSFMADQKIGSALVVEGGKAVGIFTTIDALRVLSDFLPSPSKEE